MLDISWGLDKNAGSIDKGKISVGTWGRLPDIMHGKNVIYDDDLKKGLLFV